MKSKSLKVIKETIPIKLESVQVSKYVSTSKAEQQTKKEISNMKRIRSVLGKFLDKQCIIDNRDTSRQESWLVSTSRNIMTIHPTPLNQSSIVFEISESAAAKNSEIFKAQDYDFTKVTTSQNNTVITPGAEFRSTDTLKLIWKHHKDWIKIKSIIQIGCDYPCKSTPTEEERLSDMEMMIKRGNHP